MSLLFIYGNKPLIGYCRAVPGVELQQHFQRRRGGVELEQRPFQRQQQCWLPFRFTPFCQQSQAQVLASRAFGFKGLISIPRGTGRRDPQEKD